LEYLLFFGDAVEDGDHPRFFREESEGVSRHQVESSRVISEHSLECLEVYTEAFEVEGAASSEKHSDHFRCPEIRWSQCKITLDQLTSFGFIHSPQIVEHVYISERMSNDADFLSGDLIERLDDFVELGLELVVLDRQSPVVG